MANLMEDIVEYLVDESVVSGDGVDAFRDVAPETPNDIVIVYEYPGGPPAIHTEVSQRSIQIVARSTSATTAREKALEIYNLFAPAGREINLTSERWCMSSPRQTPIKIKIDNSNRVYYGFNIGITTYTD